MASASRVFKLLSLLFITCSMAVACGGGGNPPTPTRTPAPDRTPNDYSFTAPAEAQELSATVVSNTVTITGIGVPVTVVVQNGEYRIGDGGFTSDAGTISSGQTLTLQGIASNEFETTVSVTVMVGTVERSFDIITVARDADPEPFAPAATPDPIPISNTFTYDAFEVSGLNDSVEITVASGRYAVGEGAFTTEAGSVSNGDQVRVEVTAPAEFSTTTIAMLTIGDRTEDFPVASEAEDTMPDDFELGETQTVNAPGATAESTEITINGINSAAAVTITDGEYRIADGDYTAEAGTVMNGQTVQVRAAGAETAPTDVAATLTIGGVRDTFVVSTEDITRPTTEIYFPTPTTMTEGTTLTLRGRVTDDFGPIASVRATVTDVDGNEIDVVVEEPEGDENFLESWSVTVDLATSTGLPVLNNIEVVATDAAGNLQDTIESVSRVAVHQTTIADDTEFPNVGVNEPDLQFVNLSFNSDGSLVLDSENNRLITTRGTQIYFVDIDTGQRSILPEFTRDQLALLGLQILDNSSRIRLSGAAENIVEFPIDDPRDRLVRSLSPLVPADIVQTSDSNTILFSALEDITSETGLISSLDMASGEVAEISGPNRLGGGASLLAFGFNTLMRNEESLLVANRSTDNASTSGEIIEVNLSSGLQSPLFGTPLMNIPFGMDWVVENQVLLFSGQTSFDQPGLLYIYDFNDSAPEVFIDGVPGDGRANALHLPRGILIDREKMIAYLTIAHEDARDSKGSFYILDLTNKERVVLSRTSFEL